MKIYNRFYPDLHIQKINDIDVGALNKMGIKYVILDIDNTLVSYTEPLPDENALGFLRKLRENGISFCFVSNNKPLRVEVFNKNINAPYFANAKKPLLWGIRKAMQHFNAKKSETALIGDQILTDIWGGKRAGIYSILVEPIKEVDTLFFRCKRKIEKKILKDKSK